MPTSRFCARVWVGIPEHTYRRRLPGLPLAEAAHGCQGRPSRCRPGLPSREQAMFGGLALLVGGGMRAGVLGQRVALRPGREGAAVLPARSSRCARTASSRCV
jgi:hypothetical protein